MVSEWFSAIRPTSNGIYGLNITFREYENTISEGRYTHNDLMKTRRDIGKVQVSIDHNVLTYTVPVKSLDTPTHSRVFLYIVE